MPDRKPGEEAVRPLLRWRHELPAHRRALSVAWAQPTTRRRFVLELIAVTLACVAITLVGAWVSSWVQQAVRVAVAEDTRLAEQIAPVLRKRFTLDAFFVAAALVVAPVVETLLVAVAASVGTARRWPAWLIATTSGGVFGLLHAPNGLLAVVPAALVFAVLTAAFLRWRHVALGLALLVAAIPHALLNAGVVALKAWLAMG